MVLSVSSPYVVGTGFIPVRERKNGVGWMKKQHGRAKDISPQTVDKPYTSRIGLHNLSRSAALLFSPSGAGLNEPSTARARLFLKNELC